MFASCLCACNKTDEIKIGTLATEDILPFWTAEAEGLFEEEGLNAKVEVFQSATELIAAVSANEVQLAMTDPMVAASIYASGTPVQIEWITLGTDATQGCFGIMSADKNIKTLKDLSNVEIGVGSNTILEYVMDSLMEQAGIPASKVKKNELQKLPVRYEAMKSGQVKAAALPASLLALGESQGCHIIADDTQGANISQSVMISSESFTDSSQEKETMELLKKIWNKAVDKINKNPESYRALLIEKANLSDGIAKTYPISTYPHCKLPTNKMIDPILSWMTKKGYLEQKITYDEKTGKFSK